MKFDDLDNKMRVFETQNDRVVPPDIYMVARLDGRGFTKLTKERHNFDRPFDDRFHEHMFTTVEHLMTCGFNIIYGYTQSDEISLLFSDEENTFSRKMRKLNSVLAGEASARFSLLLQTIAVFDCRISELETEQDVVDYFRWRNEDAYRNALAAHCYWGLRKRGDSAGSATRKISGLSTEEKLTLLNELGIDFEQLPDWQKRGGGVTWEIYEKPAVNPQTGETVTASRRRLKRYLNLPTQTAYSNFIFTLLYRNVGPEAAGSR
jgi:tRNA(His) guanylyltransferase